MVLALLLLALLGGLGAALGATWNSWLVGLLVGLAFAGLQYWIARAAGTQLVMMSAGARELRPGEDSQLWNVIHEAAIAAAMPPPKIWIIDDASPNAFATGFKADAAHVAITSGLRERLDRAELQAVMAHELAHIRNGDSGYMVLMAVLVGSIAMLADLGLRNLWYGRGMNYTRGERGKSGAHVAAMIIVLLLAIVAPLFSRLLQAAVSREREFLADATSVELTRNPQALVSALQKLSADATPMRRANRATQHLWIVNPMRNARGGGNAFSTHPPLTKRIERIERLYA